MSLLKNFTKKLIEGYRKIYSIRAKAESEPKVSVPIEVKEEPAKVQEVKARDIQPIKVPLEAIPLIISEKFERRRVEEEKMMEGFQIPEFQPAQVKIGRVQPSVIRERFSLVYPLIPKRPAKDETVFAYAKIFWDPKTNRHIYQVIEPRLDERMRQAISKIKEILEQKLDVDFSKLRRYEAKEYLRKQFAEAINFYGFNFSEMEKKILQYYVERDFIGLGKIEAMMNDEQIEDISCDGLDIPIFVFHRNPALGSVITNVSFHDAAELDSFVMRLAQMCGKSVSVASPLLSGALHDGSRLQATLATDIARRGSNFTIRKFTEVPLTPTHLLSYHTIDVRSLAFLWLAVDFGKSVLVSGGTASGKTTFLNVLSLFIRPEEKIVSIEDTPELKLPHPHWVPHVARTAIATEEGKKIGEIDLFDLLRGSLRQRPDYIIVGEVRGKEAYVLFQEMATGHPSLATIHAENVPKLIDRLTTPPISLPPSLITSVDIIVFLIITRYREKQVRRVNEILEVVGFDQDEKAPIVNRIFKWNPLNDKFDVVGDSVTLKKMAEGIGMTEGEIIEELERRMMILNWLQQKNILNFADVHKILNMYYKNPEKVIAGIVGGM